ncbi:MAG: hypothetical protein ACFFB5_24770 [Promethearchaeota archaeon]
MSRLREEVHRIINEDDILEALKNETQKLIVNEDVPIQIIWLAIFSCILIEKPFGLLIYSPSSAGKSYIINKIIDCLPDEYNAIQVDEKGDITIKDGFGFIDVNKITLAGLTRAVALNPSVLEGKILILHELPDDISDSTLELYQALRQYFSDGKYSRILTDEKTKKAMSLSLKGYCCMISETAKTIREEEWGNRFLFINLDESKKQNVAIAEFQSRQYLEPWNVTIPDIDLFGKIIEYYLYDEIQRDCKKVSVYNPWVEDIQNYLIKKYGDDVRIRRYTDLTFRACETITRLQFKQREKLVHESGLPYLRATKWDAAKCLWLFESMLTHTMVKLTRANIKWLKKVYKQFNTEEWTAPQAQRLTGLSKSNVYGKIQDLKDYGLIYQSGKQGRTFKYQINEEYLKSNLNVHQRSMNDIFLSLPDRIYLDTPDHYRSSTSRVSLSQGGIRNLQNDLSNSPTEVLESSNSEVIVQRTSKNDKSRHDYSIIEIKKNIFKWIDDSEEGWINKDPTITYLESEGFNRDDVSTLIDRLLNNGMLFEPKQGRLAKP